jgi:hypothetical protein
MYGKAYGKEIKEGLTQSTPASVYYNMNMKIERVVNSL